MILMWCKAERKTGATQPFRSGSKLEVGMIWNQSDCVRKDNQLEAFDTMSQRMRQVFFELQLLFVIIPPNVDWVSLMSTMFMVIDVEAGNEISLRYYSDNASMFHNKQT